MKRSNILLVLLATALKVGLSGSAAAAFDCSSKLNSCSGNGPQKICDDFRRAALMSKRQCEVVFNKYKNSCGNNTCCKGVRVTYERCGKTAK